MAAAILDDPVGRISVDVLQTAREAHGLERLDQIRFAVLEISVGISIIPRQ